MGRRNLMGRARELIAQAQGRDPRPEPSPDALRTGARRSQADGGITVVEDGWDHGEQPAARVVDRSPLRVFD
jgi:hypothetical protein